MKIDVTPLVLGAAGALIVSSFLAGKYLERYRLEREAVKDEKVLMSALTKAMRYDGDPASFSLGELQHFLREVNVKSHDLSSYNGSFRTIVSPFAEEGERIAFYAGEHELGKTTRKKLEEYLAR